MTKIVKFGMFVIFAVMFLCKLTASAEVKYEISGSITASGLGDLEEFYKQLESGIPYADINEVSKAFGAAIEDQKNIIKIGDFKVSLKGENINKTIDADEYGDFCFSDLPKGEYTITAVSTLDNIIPYQVTEPIKCSESVKIENSDINVSLVFNLLAVTVQGRLVTSDGEAVKNGKIIMTGPADIDDNKEPLSWITFTDNDGNFEFSGIPASGWRHVAKYLCNKSKGLFKSQQALIRPDVFGYKMADDSEGIYLPMITENVLYWARRDIKFMNAILFGVPEFVERNDRIFPKSKGNIIFVGDIVVSKNK